MLSENAPKKDRENSFLKRVSSRFGRDTKPLKTVIVEDDPLPIRFETREMESQTEVPHRTVGTGTDTVDNRTIGVFTDEVGRIDRDVGTDRTGMWDRAVECVPFMKDQGVDIGEWNMTLMCSVDAQTDTPDLSDPLLWCTGNIPDMRRFIATLMRSVREEYIKGAEADEEFNMTELRAENTLLKLEVDELKSRLKQANLEIDVKNIRRDLSLSRPSVAALVEAPFPRSIRYTVVAEGGVLVTSSLAPSSFPLGKVRKGDRILAAGSPEEILHQVRVPVLPRGWITVRDRDVVYLDVVSS